ncbi:MAG: DUF5691 domain-containing protein, partial [Pseudomonadota bacterium]
MAHPFDWLPPKDVEGFPDIYIPLAAWAAEAEETEATTLTEESWDAHFPAERRAAMEALRRTDPDTARTLLEAKAAGLPAEERHRLIQTLATGLSEADQPFLETLAASDRSGKVKATATRLLARLGVAGDGEAAAELAAFLEITSTGLLRRKPLLAFRKKLNDVQQNRAQTLFGSVPLAQLAIALDLTPEALIEATPTEHGPLLDAILGWGGLDQSFGCEIE